MRLQIIRFSLPAGGKAVQEWGEWREQKSEKEPGEQGERRDAREPGEPGEQKDDKFAKSLGKLKSFSASSVRKGLMTVPPEASKRTPHPNPLPFGGERGDRFRAVVPARRCARTLRGLEPYHRTKGHGWITIGKFQTDHIEIESA